MQKFAFRSKVIESRLKYRHSTDALIPPPDFCVALLTELGEQVRGMNFMEPEREGGGLGVAMFEHSYAEICAFVDWAVSIWNQTVRLELRSRALTIHELVTDRILRDGTDSRITVLLMFESWHEAEENFAYDYIPVERYPCPLFDEDPLATVGNLCAAFGLAVLDEALMLWENGDLLDTLAYFGAAWEFASIARLLNHMQMGRFFDTEFHRRQMSKAAATRYSKDPKQAIKREVQSCWLAWNKAPSSYASVAAFSRDMISKWPDQLTSEAVISRWTRQWKRDAEGSR